MEAAHVVIKVKYGNMLRRFKAQILNAELCLDINGLRVKILSLFSLAPGTELMLTYIDEDGDVVTLVNADDLRDVVKQGLDPVRITVKLISEENAGHSNHSMRALPPEDLQIPMRWPQVQQPLKSLQDGVSGILKNVPDPLREILMKFSIDLTSRVSSPSPCISKVVECILRIGLFYLGQFSECQDMDKPWTNSEITENSPAQTKAKDTNMSKDDAATPQVQSNDRELPSINSNEGLVKLQLEATTANNELEASSSEALGLNDSSSTLDSRKTNLEEKVGESSPFPTQKEPNDGPKTRDIIAPDAMKGDYLVGRIGCVLPSNQDVCCFWCGIYPITSPRFKSKIKVGYELCTHCFPKIGNDIDFIRIDSPVVHQKNMSSVHHHDPNRMPTCRVSTERSCASKLKLDSCFIEDVTVKDGTIMAPLTPFTKIWRMRNNGMAVWPQKTQLVWTGGDRMIKQSSVEVEIPAAGILTDQDLDIAVDLIAPWTPGRHVSYWTMVSPSGQRFGQRIWVLIRVDASIEEKAPETFEGLNLNLSPETSLFTGPEILSANLELPEKKAGIGASSSVNNLFDDQTKGMLTEYVKRMLLEKKK